MMEIIAVVFFFGLFLGTFALILAMGFIQVQRWLHRGKETYIYNQGLGKININQAKGRVNRGN